ncbi:hypothetical protein [Bacteriophage sp.]|nr:hypothetical protein [Bacteriophage sp.]
MAGKWRRGFDNGQEWLRDVDNWEFVVYKQRW